MNDPGAAQPTLSDEVVTLRPWRPDDATAVDRACQDAEIARFVPIPQPYTLDDARWFVASCAEESITGPSAHFAIVDPATDLLLGAISRHGPRAETPHRAAIGYWLAPEARGRGVATRAVRLLVDWSFATSTTVRMELYTDVENERSGRVARRAGFEPEGIRRAWDLDRAGRPIDSAFYVRLRST
ncbi:MAG: GNAT family N-acetyltransferase [Chloroflexi bacterium]|nr:GNAT family N-acetyltransferase [Chloroflexota bacterium]